MNEQPRSQNRDRDAVLLCRGKSCCPEVFFAKDRTVRLTADDGTTLELTVEQTEVLAETLARRGYLR